MLAFKAGLIKDAIATPTEYTDDRWKIGYGETGFETFTIDVPDALQGKVATLRFELDGGNPVYLDNVFFKSQNLLLGNPGEARNPDDADLYANNYLLEQPQYAISYSRDKQTPNWVSYQLNRSWTGSNQSRTFQGDPTLPSNWYAIPGNTFASYGYPYDRGHLAALQDKTRTSKDTVATNLMTNIVPQSNQNNNRQFWNRMEGEIRSLVDGPLNRELFVITGASGSKDRITTTSNPLLNVNIPDSIWKIVLVSNQPINSPQDIDGDTLVFAVFAPNDESVPGTGTGTWRFPGYNYLRSVREVEGLTGYNFLSNLPTELQDTIENRSRTEILARVNSLFQSPPTASLLAESTLYSDGTGSAGAAILHNGSTEGGASQAEIKTVSSSIQEIGIGEISDANRFFQVNSLQIGTQEASTSQYGRTQVSSLQTGICEISTSQVGSVHTNSTHTGFVEAGTNHLSVESSVIQNSKSQICTSKVGLLQIGSTQIGTLKLSGNEQGRSQISVGQIDVLQHSPNQVGISDDSPTKISLPSSISIQQFLSSHNYDRQNTTVPILSDFLFGDSPFNLDLAIEDLPTGQLAEAEITGFDPTGRPNSGTLTLDLDANGNGKGWFLDPTPWENSEYALSAGFANGIQNSTTAFQAQSGSEAYDRYDLFTTILHELAHLNGFIHGNPAFNQY